MPGVRSNSSLLVVARAFTLFALVLFPVSVGARDFNVVLLRPLYTDTTTTPTPATMLRAAADDLQWFFHTLSYGNLSVHFSVVEAHVAHDSNYYWAPCTGSDCPHSIFDDAAESAAIRGFNFSTKNAIALLTPCGDGGFYSGRYYISRPHVHVTIGRAWDDDCSQPDHPPNAPGPSGYYWNDISHEVGHAVEDFIGTDWSGAWNGHPSGYSSGYDLMDSCYPCGEIVYSLSGPPVMTGTHSVFPGMLGSPRVRTLQDVQTGTYDVYAIESPASSLPSNALQGVKVFVDSSTSTYYLIQVRKRILVDNWPSGRPGGQSGLYDEGVQIVQINEVPYAGQYPVTDIDTCDTTELPLGCIPRLSERTTPGYYDPRKANCLDRSLTATASPRYCWPYPLWHVGDTYTSSSDNLTISVLTALGPDGYRVSIQRTALAVRRPHLCLEGCGRFVPRGDPARYRSAMWVDSSCNGYESDVGTVGLEFGRQHDGNVVGQGDAVCLGHPNRIYARLVNIGSAAAKSVRVTFEVSDAVVASVKSWMTVGTATAAVEAGKSQDVFVTYTPASGTPALVRPTLRVSAQDLGRKAAVVVAESGSLALSSTAEAKESIALEADTPSEGAYMRIFSLQLPTGPTDSGISDAAIPTRLRGEARHAHLRAGLPRDRLQPRARIDRAVHDAYLDDASLDERSSQSEKWGQSPSLR